MDESFNFLLEKPDKIPDWVLEDNNSFFNFLAGYADSEGCWKILKNHEDGKRFVFSIVSQDQKILEQIKTKLEQLIYVVNLYLEAEAGIYKNKKNLYQLVIYQTESIMELIKAMLPFSHHDEKIEKMKLIINSKNKKWNEIREEFRKITKKIKETRFV